MVEAILDTDIGSDVDDALALCLALVSGEIELLGVTTVYGQTLVRARLARALARAAGHGELPVFAGLELPLLRERPVHWMGHEGIGVDLARSDLAPDQGSAVDFIVRTIRERPGRVSIIAIGPLTNVAAAIIVAPDIVALAREVIFIGGVARLAPNRLDVPSIEWNVRCDPEAARVVFRSGMKVTMLGMDVTRREETHMDQSHLQALRDAPSPLARMAACLVEVYWGTIGNDLRFMHDVVAVAFSFDRSLVLTEPLDVVIETTGTHTQGFTLVTRGKPENPVRVGTGLDGTRIRTLFFDRVCAPLTGR